MGQQPLRAALYCRVSTADQSCARQERDLAAFAERAGYEVVGTYKETASGVRLDRAGPITGANGATDGPPRFGRCVACHRYGVRGGGYASVKVVGPGGDIIAAQQIKVARGKA